MAKKAKRKSKQGGDKPSGSGKAAAGKKDVTVELHLPTALYKKYEHWSKQERSDELRSVFRMLNIEDTRRDMKYCLIFERPQSDDGSSDDGVYPIKLCEEGE